MALTISLANAIRFRPVDGNLANIDNSFDFDRTANNRFISNEFQQRFSGCAITLQAMSATGDAVTMRAWYNQAWVDIIADSLTTLGDFDYTEFVIDFDKEFIENCVVFEATDGTDIWRSEPILCEAYDDNFVKLEWFNFDNAFTMNYQTGIVPAMWLPANIGMITPSGESVVYSNQGTETKLKENIQRMLSFECFIPDYIAEQLIVATAHDKFFINEIEYVTNKKPTIEQQGNSNVYKLSADLNQASVLGLNTHDTGFDVDGGGTISTEIMNLELLNVSGDNYLSIPAGYLLHTITVLWVSGTGILVKAGTTAGADDLMNNVNPASGNPGITTSIHQDSPSVSTVYFTITGSGVVNIYMQLIKNRV